MTIHETPQSLTIRVRIKRYVLPIALHVMLALALGVGVIIGLIGLVFVLTNRVALVQHAEWVIASFFLFPLFLNSSFWYLFGYEEMVIDKKQLTYRRSNRLLSRSKRYPLDAIESIECWEKKVPDSWIGRKHLRMREAHRAFLWQDMGHIDLIAVNSYQPIFNGLLPNEVKEVCTLLRKVMR